MTVMPSLPTAQTAQYRLAQHYLKKLRTASEAVTHGRANLVYGLRLFDQDWSQIQFWQSWSVQHQRFSDEWAWLCKEFPFAGLDVLAIRHTAAERRDWWEAALDAARRLCDREAERTILPHLAMAFSGLGDLERTEQCTRQLFDLANDAKDLSHIGKALYHLGTVLEDLGKHAEAISCYRRCLTIFEELGLAVDRGRALLGLGSVATITGDYQDAYTCFLEYLEIAEGGGKESDLCIALMAVSEALRYLKRHHEMEPYLQRSIQICRALDYQWALGPSLIAMGVCAAEMSNLEAAMLYLAEGVQIARNSGARRDMIYGLSSLGYVSYRRGYTAEAVEPLLEALALAHEMPYFTCYIQRNLAYVYLALGKHDAARRALHESLAIAWDLGIVPEMIKTLTCAVAYAFHLGLWQEASLWAGYLMGNPNLDEIVFNSICHDLEVTLGAECYHQALEQGKALTLENIVAGILTLLS